ncbi:neuronal acetylcholine receptor subunit alpha-10-like [Amphiura filiformis]|uniref:neuronal acetylcholine receptor subunit alpha-10-like n=1 Tax=Amphiura filiformis TaxID=82378 RepID=UPI003B228172
MSGARPCTVVLLFVAVIAGFKGVSATPDDYRLLNDMFTNYSTLVRPVKYSYQPIEVKLGAALQQIIEMDEKNQVITVSLWMRLQWTDYTLTWDPASYGNTTYLIVPAEQIWRPDIVLYSNVDSGFGGMMDTNAGVDNTGVVYWNAPAIYTSTCKIDVSYFPFDEQVCPLKFGSWAYNGLQVDLTNRSGAGDTSAYINSGEWDLIGMPVFRHNVYYACCAAPYPDVTFKVVIRRLPLFYMLNLLVPCFLVSCLTALDFFMPADAGEKVTLGITILLALIVFLLLVAETMPPQSEVVPLIGQYFACTIVLVSMSTVMTVFVLSLHYRLPGTKPVPKWMRNVFLKHVACFLCLGDLTKLCPPHDEEDEDDDDKATVLKNNGHSNQNVYSLSEMVQQSKEADPGDVIVSKNFDGYFTTIITKLGEITGRYKDDDRDDSVMLEWQYLALVMDRFFFVVFMGLTVICTVAILLQPKPYTDPGEL